MSGKLALVEKFLSLQGEGRNAGRAAIFIRFAGCNLACDFAGDGTALCDTPWQHAQEKISLSELLAWVNKQYHGPFPSPTVVKKQAPMVVITGGEPTMAPAFDELVYALKDKGLYVAVESNGTRMRDGLKYVDWLVVSPKDEVAQGNPVHGQPLAEPTVLNDVVPWVHEWRYVIGPASPTPPHYGRHAYHCISPAILSDGSGQEWKSGWPGFVPGAVERCMEIMGADPRWRLSIQTHKLLGVR